LERYYDAKRSARLEGTIQDLFGTLDKELAALRNSEIVGALRAGRKPTDQEKEAASLWQRD
jgi:hypothetical protein